MKHVIGIFLFAISLQAYATEFKGEVRKEKKIVAYTANEQFLINEPYYKCRKDIPSSMSYEQALNVCASCAREILQKNLTQIKDFFPVKEVIVRTVVYNIFGFSWVYPFQITLVDEKGRNLEAEIDFNCKRDQNRNNFYDVTSDYVECTTEDFNTLFIEPNTRERVLGLAPEDIPKFRSVVGR